MLNAAIDGPEDGEQPGPGVVTAVEHFRPVMIGFFCQLTAQGGNGVASVVDRIAEKKQTASAAIS